MFLPTLKESLKPFFFFYKIWLEHKNAHFVLYQDWKTHKIEWKCKKGKIVNYQDHSLI